MERMSHMVLMKLMGVLLMGWGVVKTKKVLILMSDTGCGHRASAKAIKTAFNQEFGDEYKGHPDPPSRAGPGPARAYWTGLDLDDSELWAVIDSAAASRYRKPHLAIKSSNHHLTSRNPRSPFVDEFRTSYDKEVVQEE